MDDFRNELTERLNDLKWKHRHGSKPRPRGYNYDFMLTSTNLSATEKQEQLKKIYGQIYHVLKILRLLEPCIVLPIPECNTPEKK
jgi:hypothetical protein